MFAALKKMFRRPAPQQPFSKPLPAAPKEPRQAKPFQQQEKSSIVAPAANPAQPIPQPTPDDSLTLPLNAIVNLVPKEFCASSSSISLEGCEFQVSRKHVRAQLSQGAVKIPFGEVRRAAPVGVFINSSAHDHTPVDLPLREILRQLRPDALARSQQRLTEVPAEVTDVFGPKGKPLAQVRILTKDESARSASLASAAGAKPSAAVSKPPVSAPAAAPAKVSMPARAASPTAAPQLPQAKVQASASPATKPESAALVITVAQILEGWPEAVRQEITELDLLNAKCELPADEIGVALKSGKVQYPWKRIRSWIKPAPGKAHPSPHAEVLLELPLQILAPLFLSHSQTVQPKRKLSVAANIPDVFSKSQPPAAPESAPAKSAAHSPVPQAPAARETAVSEEVVLTILLSEVSGNWPEPVLKEINHLNLCDAKLELPLKAVEVGLKLGKVDYLWKQLAQWLKPSSPAVLASVHAETRLELPLNVVAPLYLQLRPASQPPKKSAVSTNIPDVFSAKGLIAPSPDTEPAISAPAPATVRTAPAPATVRTAPTPVAPPAPQKIAENLAELFGEPDKRNWTPNEIVHKSSHLPGVSGSLIALQDGLLVAACMPPTWKTETVAAFLPQIFGRMNQYAKELKMGDLNSITFTVDHGTLHIFNAGIIYFAALGRPGEPLPMPQLNLIAHELSRHTK